MQSAGLNNRSMQSSEKLWRHLRILINRQDYWSFDGMRSNTISNWRDSTAQWIDTTGFLSRTQTSWNNLEPPYRARGCPVGRDCGTGRWCADAGRPTRFKPSSPSPTDAVRDGLDQARSSGSERYTRARPHAVTPMNCVPEDSRRRSTCTGRTHSPRALADGNQTPSSTVAVRAPSPS